MTYNEIHHEVYRPKDPNEKPMILSEDEAKAWSIIYGLKDRKGFDGWWGSIDGEIQDEIFESIVEIIREK